MPSGFISCKPFRLDFPLYRLAPACGRREAEQAKAPEQSPLLSQQAPQAHSPEAGPMATGTLAEGRQEGGKSCTCSELSRLLEVGQGNVAEDVECRKQKC